MISTVGKKWKEACEEQPSGRKRGAAHTREPSVPFLFCTSERHERQNIDERLDQSTSIPEIQKMKLNLEKVPEFKLQLEQRSRITLIERPQVARGRGERQKMAERSDRG